MTIIFIIQRSPCCRFKQFSILYVNTHKKLLLPCASFFSSRNLLPFFPKPAVGGVERYLFVLQVTHTERKQQPTIRRPLWSYRPPLSTHTCYTAHTSFLSIFQFVPQFVPLNLLIKWSGRLAIGNTAQQVLTQNVCLTIYLFFQVHLRSRVDRPSLSIGSEALRMR